MPASSNRRCAPRGSRPSCWRSPPQACIGWSSSIRRDDRALYEDGDRAPLDRGARHHRQPGPRALYGRPAALAPEAAALLLPQVDRHLGVAACRWAPALAAGPSRTRVASSDAGVGETRRERLARPALCALLLGAAHGLALQLRFGIPDRVSW